MVISKQLDVRHDVIHLATGKGNGGAHTDELGVSESSFASWPQVLIDIYVQVIATPSSDST